METSPEFRDLSDGLTSNMRHAPAKIGTWTLRLLLGAVALFVLLNVLIWVFWVFFNESVRTTPNHSDQARIARALGSEVAAKCRIERLYVHRVLFGGEGHDPSAYYMLQVNAAAFKDGFLATNPKAAGPEALRNWGGAVDAFVAKRSQLTTQATDERMKELQVEEYYRIRSAADRLIDRLGPLPDRLVDTTAYLLAHESVLFADQPTSGTVRAFLRTPAHLPSFGYPPEVPETPPSGPVPSFAN